jgi:hypothetical protein
MQSRGSRHISGLDCFPGTSHRFNQERLESICKVFIVAMLLEVVYQVMTHRWEYRGYFLVAAFVSAICPYLLLRGPTNRLVSVMRRKN